MAAAPYILAVAAKYVLVTPPTHPPSCQLLGSYLCRNLTTEDIKSGVSCARVIFLVVAYFFLLRKALVRKRFFRGNVSVAYLKALQPRLMFNLLWNIAPGRGLDLLTG